MLILWTKLTKSSRLKVAAYSCLYLTWGSAAREQKSSSDPSLFVFAVVGTFFFVMDKLQKISRYVDIFFSAVRKTQNKDIRLFFIHMGTAI